MTNDSEPESQPVAGADNVSMFNVPAVVLAVVAVLAAIHGALWLLGESWQVWMVYAFSFIPARLGGGEVIPAPFGASVWSFLTYALLHADIYHLGANSIWLLIFSTPLARRLGAARYLVLLALSAVAGAVAMVPLHWGAFLIVIGASASVSGVMAAAIPIMFAPGFQSRSPSGLQELRVLTFAEFMRDRRALVFAGVFLVLTLFSGASQSLTGTAFLEERSIAWEAHLGGFLAGLVAFFLLDRTAIPAQSPR